MGDKVNNITKRSKDVALFLSLMAVSAIVIPLSAPVFAARECFPFPDAQPQYCVVYSTSLVEIDADGFIFHCWVHTEIEGTALSYEALGQTGCKEPVEHVSVTLRLTRPPVPPEHLEEWGQCVSALCDLAEARISYPYSKCVEADPDWDCSIGRVELNRHLITRPYEITGYVVVSEVQGDPVANCQVYERVTILCYTNADVEKPVT